MTLAERKRETRDALVFAALQAFARDGYHAASLDAIATDAGYSKGAIYSNFDGKAGLFLAVMDHNLQMLGDRDWNPLLGATDAAATPATSDEATQWVRGFALATLEFIVTAARDETLSEKLRQRTQVMVDEYQEVATAARPSDEQLPAEDVGRLMAALDQGATVLTLSGLASMDGTLLRIGLRRLLDPGGAASDPASGHDDRSSPLPVVEQVQRLIQNPSDP